MDLWIRDVLNWLGKKEKCLLKMEEKCVISIGMVVRVRSVLSRRTGEGVVIGVGVIDVPIDVSLVP